MDENNLCAGRRATATSSGPRCGSRAVLCPAARTRATNSPRFSCAAPTSSSRRRRCSPRCSPTSSGAGSSSLSKRPVLSTAKLKFVLDGDKLFALRACASGRPWWQLPLTAQYVAAPRCAAPPPLATTFRCVLLDAADATASITARFVADRRRCTTPMRKTGGTPAGRHAALLARCATPTRCLFVEVRAATAGSACRRLLSIAAWTATTLGCCSTLSRCRPPRRLGTTAAAPCAPRCRSPCRRGAARARERAARGAAARRRRRRRSGGRRSRSSRRPSRSSARAPAGARSELLRARDRLADRHALLEREAASARRR